MGCYSLGASTRDDQVSTPQLSIFRRLPSRTLFELHAGRRDYEPPAGLLIDESRSVLSDKNELPRSTSGDLIEALGPIGIEYEKPKEHGFRNDLSYSDALTAVLDPREAARQAEINIKSSQDKKWGLHPKDILIKFLQHVAPILEYQARSGGIDESELNRALSKVFRRSNEQYLQKRGWDVTDFMDWAWILSASTTERAASRLSSIGRLGFQATKQHKVVPQFVTTFLLRRRNISAPALSKIIGFLWDFMAWLSEQKAGGTPGQTMGQKRSGQHPGMKDFVFMVIIVRLLRNARHVMPAAYESIISLLCRYLDDSAVFKTSSQSAEDVDENQLAALTFMYNSALALIASPAYLHPYRSATHQQRAQFIVLRRMAQYEPPLLVDRRGYRAVTQILLMQKKTAREREWALFKALSWPPWKENRLGTDADIGPEFGISQAKEVLNQAKEAGYAADDWDDAASILAGWDTDDSPTIQNRAMLKGHVPSKYRSNRKDDRTKSTIWAARIRATRTLQEAWAAFLSFEDSRIDKYSVVYFAMFEKLFAEAKRRTKAKKHTSQEIETGFLPGDGLEVFPTPITPRHTVYNRTSPPSIEDFFQKMTEDGLRLKPQGAFLSMLLRNAPTLAAGFRFLTASNLPLEYTSALLTQSTSKELLKKLPSNLFAAFIEFLTRASWGGLLLKDGLDFSKLDHVTSSDAQRPPQTRAYWRPAYQAIWLVLERQPRERPPWYSVLAALARSGVVSPIDSCSTFDSYSAIANWKTTCTMLTAIEDIDLKLDLGVMKILCTGLEKAIFEAEDVILQKEGKTNIDENLQADLDFVLNEGMSRVKNIFKDIVRSERMQQDIPQSILESQFLQDSGPREESQDDDMDDVDEDFEDETSSSRRSENYLPSACLIPRLLEVPDTAQLHSFIRILGLRRDYQGILDLIEWMSLYRDEIRASMEEQKNGMRMMRRCLTAARVFLERSWPSYLDPGHERLCVEQSDDVIEPAPVEIWQIVRDTILETPQWGGWPTDDEVENYCLKGRFI